MAAESTLTMPSTVEEASETTTNGVHASLDTSMDALSLKEDESPKDPEPDTSDYEAICKQVDHYFSDDNLRSDKFLLGKMHGRDNLPIPLEIIHGFNKMQRFTMGDVVAALESSVMVNLVEHEMDMCIQRKIPFIKPGKKSSGSKKKIKPTGFEEYWADAPLTPDEFEEEQDVYSSDRPFAERIETALQRFQKKRKFHAFPSDVFTKWLKYGGIYTGPKQFTGGLDAHDLESKTASDIAAMTATTYAGEDKLLEGKDAIWAVDFESVAKGFLSYAAPSHFDLDSTEKVTTCCKVLHNFYNYILHHNVCPEYHADIEAARKICDLAEKELLAVYKVSHTSPGGMCLPGDFNLACSCLFGEKGTHISSGWTTANASDTQRLSLTDVEARQAFALAHAAYGDPALFSEDKYEYDKQLYLQEVIEFEEDIGLEVTGVEFASPYIRELYSNSESTATTTTPFLPIGKLHCKTWDPPSFAVWDVPPGISTSPPQKVYEFWIEDSILRNCFPGMKIEGTVHTLTSGLAFLVNITAVWCSFYTVLPNELSRKWKEPKWVTREMYLANEARRAEGEEEDVPGVDEL